jgi:hypothetical protein
MIFGIAKTDKKLLRVDVPYLNVRPSPYLVLVWPLIIGTDLT